MYFMDSIDDPPVLSLCVYDCGRLACRDREQVHMGDLG
jgi:hypothetical protein